MKLSFESVSDREYYTRIFNGSIIQNLGSKFIRPILMGHQFIWWVVWAWHKRLELIPSHLCCLRIEFIRWIWCEFRRGKSRDTTARTLNPIHFGRRSASMKRTRRTLPPARRANVLDKWMKRTTSAFTIVNYGDLKASHRLWVPGAMETTRYDTTSCSDTFSNDGSIEDHLYGCILERHSRLLLNFLQGWSESDRIGRSAVLMVCQARCRDSEDNYMSVMIAHFYNKCRKIRKLHSITLST